MGCPVDFLLGYYRISQVITEILTASSSTTNSDQDVSQKKFSALFGGSSTYVLSVEENQKTKFNRSLPISLSSVSI